MVENKIKYGSFQKSNQSKPQVGNKKTKNKEQKRRIKGWVLAGVAGFAIGKIFTQKNIEMIIEQIREGRKYTISKISLDEGEKAVIITEDGTFELDENAFAIIKGKIKEGKNDACAYDKYGNILEGTIDSIFVEEIMTVSQREINEYGTIYRVANQEGAGVRTSTTIEADNISYTAEYGEYVLGSEYSDEGEWIEVLSTNGEEIFKGYVDEDDLKKITSIEEKEEYTEQENLLRIVDTSRDNYIDLKLRGQPEIGENIITKIPHGATINIIGDTIKDEKREWVKVEYIDEAGNKWEGWASKTYLKEIEEEEQQKVQNVEINATGNVTGIDISGMTLKNLRKLLEKGIPNEVDPKHSEETDTTQLEGKINFVIMKLGKSTLKKGSEFKIDDYSGYEEQAKVCEEMGIPFGFYYYSTAVNKQEAEIELKYIEEEIQRLKEIYNYKYNTIPVVIDVELNSKKDRQYGESVENISYAKAHIINGLQKAGISEKVLIYGPGRVMDSNDSDQLIDLDILKKECDNFAIWLCSPIKEDGKDYKANKKYYDLIEGQYGIDIVNRQVVLDAVMENDWVDIDNMEIEYYNEL